MPVAPLEQRDEDGHEIHAAYRQPVFVAAPVARVVADVTEAVLDAEEGRRPRDKGRVWVFPTEVLDGRWGARGRIVRLAEILRPTHDDAEEARALAAKPIAACRAERAAIS